MNEALLWSGVEASASLHFRLKLADLIKPVPSATSQALEAPAVRPANGHAPAPAKPRKPLKTKTGIREEAEMVPLFADLLAGDPDLTWVLPEAAVADQPLPSVELELEGHRQSFKPVYDLKPSQAAMSRMLRKAKGSTPLLLTAELTDHLHQLCRKLKLCAMDLNGRAHLRAPGLLVDRGALPGRTYKLEVEPRNIFVGKSARIVRTLLTDRDRDWSQRDISQRTQASAGLISRVLQHLTKQGWLEKAGQYNYRLAALHGLLTAWGESDDLWSRTQTMRLAAPERSPLEVAHELRAWAKSRQVSIAFTHELASSLRHPGTLPSDAEPRITAAYLSRFPEPATLEMMNLKPLGLEGVDSANPSGELWLHVPDDEGVFLETQPSFRFVPILHQHLNLDLPLVSDAQLYLDLLKTTAPGPARAGALLEWGRFCSRDAG